MTRDRIVVLAVTKMLSGMCTGGISLSTDKWVRPVKEHSTLLLGDLRYPDRTVIRPFDIVDFTLFKPRPKPPHVEDWVCDFVRARPVLAGRLDDRLGFLNAHADPEGADHIARAQCSLALIRPSAVEAVFTMDSFSGKYEARLRIPEMGPRALPVTDIKWRALGRALLRSSDRLALTCEALHDRLGVSDVFVALGLGRMYEGKHWPLVVGVHTCPDYQADIDYSDL